MEGQKFIFNLKTYPDNLKKHFKNLFEDRTYADVTLVSDDLKSFHAHRNILAGSCSVFGKILEHTIPNSVLFLKGINYDILDLLLKFIYIGETSVPMVNLNQFMNICKDMEIVDWTEIEKFPSQAPTNEKESTIDGGSKQQSLDIPIGVDHQEEKESNLNENESSQKLEENSSNESLQLDTSTFKLKCSECVYECLRKSDMTMHKIRHHNYSENLTYNQYQYRKRTRYNCSYCEYFSTRKQGLSSHHIKCHVNEVKLSNHAQIATKKYNDDGTKVKSEKVIHKEDNEKSFSDTQHEFESKSKTSKGKTAATDIMRNTPQELQNNEIIDKQMKEKNCANDDLTCNNCYEAFTLSIDFLRHMGRGVCK